MYSLYCARFLAEVSNITKNIPRKYLGTTTCVQDSNEINPPSNEPFIPAYQEKIDEPVNLKRARLLYQSRKRGMLENGLVLSTFAAKYLNSMEGEVLSQYDRLINLPTNDWDIYYWATGVKPTPLEFSNVVMDMLKEHVKNKDRESRIRQPDLTFDNV